jgi:hypothetical protein
MTKNQIFVTAAASTNPIKVTLPHLETGKMKELYLREFSIKGVPTTAGVPDDLFFDMEIEHQSANNQFMNRNDNRRGYPLKLTGAFTTDKYDTPVKVVDFGNTTRVNDFNIKLSTPTGTNNATYTSIAFWFECV